MPDTFADVHRAEITSLLENLCHVVGGPPKHQRKIKPMGHEPAHLGPMFDDEHGGQRFESTPVHGDLPPKWGAVKFLPPLVSNRFLIPSKSKKKASLRLPAKNV
jgi:hypothetical protein